MRGGKIKTPNRLGYTLVEVMIFVAISGFMFVLAAVFVSGKQANVEYRQSLNNVNTQVQAALNSVANGEYPSFGNFTCATLPNDKYNFNASATTQGTNAGTGNKDGCTFIGMVMQFGVAGDDTAYYTYTVAGHQYASTDPSCTPVAAADDITPASFCQAKPVAVDRTAPKSINLTQYGKLTNGLKLTKIQQCIAACSSGVPTLQTISAVGFFGSFASYGAAGSTDLQSGAQSVSVVTLAPNAPPNDETAMVNNINNNLQNVTSASPSVVNNGSFVLLCFNNGNKKGAVTIGGTNAQQLTTTVIYGASGLAQSC